MKDAMGNLTLADGALRIYSVAGGIQRYSRHAFYNNYGLSNSSIDFDPVDLYPAARRVSLGILRLAGDDLSRMLPLQNELAFLRTSTYWKSRAGCSIDMMKTRR